MNSVLLFLINILLCTTYMLNIYCNLTLDSVLLIIQDSVLLHNTIRHNIGYGNLNASEEQIYRSVLAARIIAIV